MPEQMTKYPDITLQVLKESGAQCGIGAQQKILKQCPADRFCSLPTGELCIYGLDEIPKMTQVTQAEMAKIVCPTAGGPIGWDSGATAMILAAGAVIGATWSRTRRRPGRR